MFYRDLHPPELTEAQVAQVMARQIRNMRWPEYAALERQYGLDTLPDEARTAGLSLARRIKYHRTLDRRAEEGWHLASYAPLPFVLSFEPYLMILAHYLSEARLTFVVSDIRRLGLDSDRAQSKTITENFWREMHGVEPHLL